MKQPKILVFAGSIRTGALSGKLAALAAKEIALADGDVTHISLADYPLPIYNGDLEKEKGVPENAGKLARLIAAQQGVFIATPEYNNSLPPLLKNTIDWISRLRAGNAGINYRHRVYGIGSTSDGLIGGARALIDLRRVVMAGARRHPHPREGRDLARPGGVRRCRRADQRGAVEDAEGALPPPRRVRRAVGGLALIVVPAVSETGIPRMRFAPLGTGLPRDTVCSANDIDLAPMPHATIHPRDRLIVALDLPDVAEARAMVDRLGDGVSFYKVGLELIFAGGLDFARELVALRQAGLPRRQAPRHRQHGRGRGAEHRRAWA